jgi:hypothetical protein
MAERFIIRYGLPVALLGLLLAGAPSSAQAQDLKIGVRGGGNLASIRGDTEAIFQDTPLSGRLGRRVAFHLAGVVQMGISEVFTLQPEVMYTQKGASLDVTISLPRRTVEESQTARYNYLEVPVLAKVVIPTAGPLEPAVFAGPSIAFTLSSEVETTRQGSGETTSSQADIPGTDFNAVLGGGLVYRLASGGAIELDLRYTPGLRSLNNTEGGPWQNDVISAGIAYMVTL